MELENTGKFARKDSLCWHCSRAEDGTCTWACRFVPVEGWDAKESEVYRESYNVNGCPLFARYATNGMDDKGAELLCDNVIARAGKDYLELLMHEKELQDNDVALNTKRAVYGRHDVMNKEPIKWGRAVSSTWLTLYRFEQFNNEILALERFFRSEKAELFCINIDPVYIMEAIQKQIGIRNGTS